MTKYKLSYFDIYGRAEISRLMFAAAKVEYEDHRFTIEDWPSIKSSLFTFDYQNFLVGKNMNLKDFGICIKNIQNITKK